MGTINPSGLKLGHIPSKKFNRRIAKVRNQLRAWVVGKCIEQLLKAQRGDHVTIKALENVGVYPTDYPRVFKKLCEIYTKASGKTWT
jgi:hypothetical protein